MRKMWKVKVEKKWKHAGLNCIALLLTGEGGFCDHRCAYVGVPKSHIAYNMSYSDLNIEHAHGGLTYAKMGNGKDGFLKNLYWFGVDYAHSFDNLEDNTLEKVISDTNILAEEVGRMNGFDVLPYQVRDFIDTTTLAQFKAYKNRVKP
jgi:hypothetical protein